MTASHILQLNAAFTTAGAIGMLAARGTLPGLFGLDGPVLPDIVAIGLLAYAAILLLVARRSPVSREALLAFTAADAAWVVGSGLVLVLFWGQISPIARVLVLAVAMVVEVFAAFQFRAARVARTAGASRIPA